MSDRKPTVTSISSTVIEEASVLVGGTIVLPSFTPQKVNPSTSPSFAGRLMASSTEAEMRGKRSLVTRRSPQTKPTMPIAAALAPSPAPTIIKALRRRRARAGGFGSGMGSEGGKSGKSDITIVLAQHACLWY